MKADQMTFGIEIECFIPRQAAEANGVSVGGYFTGNACPALPFGWRVKHDGSLATRKRNMVAVEVVSPVLRGADGIEQAKTVVGKLNEWGATTNKTTGFHVHVGAQLDRDVKALKRLVYLVAKFERALFAITGTKSREHGTYSRPMNTVFDELSLRLHTCRNNVAQAVRGVSRYYSLNLTNLGGRKNTVEFRVFQGTTNLTKILGYIQTCLALVENAYDMKRTPTRACRNVRHQNGYGLVYRMIRNFNWASEKRLGDRRYGVLDPESIDAVKKEFRRLARKYDGDQSDIQHQSLRAVV